MFKVINIGTKIIKELFKVRNNKTVALFRFKFV